MSLGPPRRLSDSDTMEGEEDDDSPPPLLPTEDDDSTPTETSEPPPSIDQNGVPSPVPDKAALEMLAFYAGGGMALFSDLHDYIVSLQQTLQTENMVKMMDDTLSVLDKLADMQDLYSNFFHTARNATKEMAGTCSDAYFLWEKDHRHKLRQRLTSVEAPSLEEAPSLLQTIPSLVSKMTGTEGDQTKVMREIKSEVTAAEIREKDVKGLFLAPTRAEAVATLFSVEEEMRMATEPVGKTLNYVLRARQQRVNAERELRKKIVQGHQEMEVSWHLYKRGVTEALGMADRAHLSRYRLMRQVVTRSILELPIADWTNYNPFFVFTATGPVDVYTLDTWTFLQLYAGLKHSCAADPLYLTCVGDIQITSHSPRPSPDERPPGAWDEHKTWLWQHVGAWFVLRFSTTGETALVMMLGSPRLLQKIYQDDTAFKEPQRWTQGFLVPSYNGIERLRRNADYLFEQVASPQEHPLVDEQELEAVQKDFIMTNLFSCVTPKPLLQENGPPRLPNDQVLKSVAGMRDLTAGDYFPHLGEIIVFVPRRPSACPASLVPETVNPVELQLFPVPPQNWAPYLDPGGEVTGSPLRNSVTGFGIPYPPRCTPDCCCLHCQSLTGDKSELPTSIVPLLVVSGPGDLPLLIPETVQESRLLHTAPIVWTPNRGPTFFNIGPDGTVVEMGGGQGMAYRSYKEGENGTAKKHPLYKKVMKICTQHHMMGPPSDADPYQLSYYHPDDAPPAAKKSGIFSRVLSLFC